MAKAVGYQLLGTALTEFVPHATSLAINGTDKVGFDLDTTGRKRQTRMIEEQVRSTYNSNNMRVNIAIWNMHLEEEHHFEGIRDSGIQKMGNGGGFRVVVFTGKGFLKNKGARGFENWCCSGNQHQDGNTITFGAQLNKQTREQL